MIGCHDWGGEIIALLFMLWSVLAHVISGVNLAQGYLQVLASGARGDRGVGRHDAVAYS